ncbi:MAG: transporter [Oligoflexia bacterium]|nr:transporter [Oligoflexia bacterium]
MSLRFNAVYLAIVLSFIGVIGDYLLKIASEGSTPFYTLSFCAGLLVYASLAVGWVYVFPHLKLATLGTIYGVSTTFFLVLAGLYRGERLSSVEGVGVVLGVLAMILLKRF